MVASFVAVIDPSPRAIAKRHRELARSLRSWRAAWRAAAPLVARGIRENLERQGGPIGASWAPLKPDTVRRKARLGRNRGPLIGTGLHILNPLSTTTASAGGAPQGRDERGRFVPSAAPAAAPDNIGSAVVQLSATRMKVGLASKVANIQHYGSSKRGLPARRFVDWNRAMEAAVIAAMDAYARQAIAAIAAKIRGDRGKGPR